MIHSIILLIKTIWGAICTSKFSSWNLITYTKMIKTIAYGVCTYVSNILVVGNAIYRLWFEQNYINFVLYGCTRY